MASENPTLQIPRDVIEPIINAHVAAAVSQALDGRATLLNEAINRVMTIKVDENGNPCTYNSARPWLEWAVGATIKKAAAAALQAELAKHEDALRAAISQQIRAKNSPLLKHLADAMVKGVTAAAADKWRLKIEINGE